MSQYSYDANGNRLSHWTLSGTDTGAYDAQDRMLAYANASYSYTRNGDLRTKVIGPDTTRYRYDNLGNLREVTMPSGDKIEYVVDGQNRRIAKIVNGRVTKRWVHAGQLTPAAELDSAGNVVSRFVGGYFTKDGATYRLITDHIGSIRMVVNASTGVIAQKLEYDEFGNVTYDSNPDFQPFGYAGGLYDTHTELVRFGARDYDARAGRWTCKDPIGFEGGVSNIYEYCINDPVNHRDIKGMQSIVPDVLQQLNLVSVNLGLARVLANEALKEAEAKFQQLPDGRQGLHNGPADAWRHARWSGQMACKIGPVTSYLVGTMHEIQGLLKGQPIDEMLMDLHNNAMGRTGENPDSLLIHGKLRIIKMP